MPTVLKVTQIEITPDGEHLIAVADDGTLWTTSLKTSKGERVLLGAAPVEWQPLPAPTR